MKRNLLAISLCTLLALSLGACEDTIPPIYTGDEDVYEHGSDTDEDLEDNTEENTPTHTEHTYGDYTYDPSSPEEGHYQVCSECGEKSAIIEHTFTTTGNGSDTHTRLCSICGYEVSETHTLVLVDDENETTHHEECELCDYMSPSVSQEYEISKDSNGVTHSGKCKCGAEYLPEGHSYIYEIVEGGHIVTCSICDYEEYESHYMYNTEHSEGAHTSICICGASYEVCEDATYYSVTDENIHTELCTMCDYSVEGDHSNKGCTDGNCEVCDFSAGLVYTESYGYYCVSGYGTYSGTELVFPNSYENKEVKGTSGGGAFAVSDNAASSITYIRIPKNMVEIGSNDFINAPYLEKVEFEEGSKLESIGYRAFYIKDEYVECASHDFTELHLPSSLTIVGRSSFYNRQHLETITFGENSQLETIDVNAFSYCASLTSLTIPASVTSIEECGFYGCESLATLTFEEGSKLETIGTACFYNCYILTDFTLPSGITSIGDNAFRECQSIKSLTIPASVVSIGSYAFYDCNSLESLTFEKGSQLETIGAYAFRGCTSLDSIVIPASVKTICDSAFRIADDSSSLISITFEEGSLLETIEQYAFRGCKNLKSLTIPNGVTSIGKYAFAYCNSLESLTIPASLTSIDEYAFYEGTSLTSLTFEEGSQLESIGRAAFDYSALTSVTIPASVEKLGRCAFGDSETLTEFTVEGSSDGTSKLTTLSEAIFADDTALETVTLPGSITSIQIVSGNGIAIFKGCTSLTTINFYGTQDQWCTLAQTGLLGLDSLSQTVTVNYLTPTTPAN